MKVNGSPIRSRRVGTSRKNLLSQSARCRRIRNWPWHVQPSFESLEDRIVMTADFYSFGGLMVYGEFGTDPNAPDQLVSNTFDTDVPPVQVGLPFGNNDEFRSLLQIDGHVYIPDKDSKSTEFQIGDPIDKASTISLASLPSNPTIWSIQDDIATFDANKLSGKTSGGLTLTDAGTLQGIGYAKINSGLLAHKITLKNPGKVADSFVELDGELSFENVTGIQLEALDVGVTAKIAKGIEVDSFSKEITANFNVGSVGITGTIVVDYTRETGEFGFYGKTKFESEGLTDASGSTLEVQMGTSSKEPGMVITGGHIDTLKFGFTGDIKAFGLEIKPKDLTFEYDISREDFIMYGELTVTVPNGKASDSGKNTTSITGKFGKSDDDPGLIVDTETGVVEHVNVGVSGNINVLGFVLTVPAKNPVHFAYEDDVYELSGQVTAPQLWKTTVKMGTEAQPGIVIKDGKWSVDDLKVAFSDIKLGAFEIKDFDVEFKQDGTDLDFEIDLDVKFPGDFEIAGDMSMIFHQSNKHFAVHEVFLKWRAETDEGRVPIGSTGMFVREMDATVENLNHPNEMIVSGHLTTEYGHSVNLFGKKSKFISAVGSFTVDKNHLELDADVFLGSVTSTNGGKPSGVFGEGNGKLVLDWNDGVYSLDLDAKLLDGVFEIDAQLEITDSFQIWVAADAKVVVPHKVPLIGGKTLASLDFRLAYDHNDLGDSYVAAWATIDLIFTKQAIGIEYAFDEKKFKVIGNSAIKQLSKDPFHQDSQPVYSQQFSVPKGATSATFSVDFPSNDGTQTISITPPGGSEIMQKNFDPSTNGIHLLTDQDSPTSINVSLAADPHNPTTLLPTGDYTVKLYSNGYTFANSTAGILQITDDGDGNTKIELIEEADGLQVNDMFSVTGNKAPSGGDSPYNATHVVESISSDGLVLVTDQLFDSSVGRGNAGTAKGWQQPQFSATFFNPAPSVELTQQPPSVPNSQSLQLPVGGFADKAFESDVSVSLYVDRDSTGYDGLLLQKDVPVTFDDDGNFTATTNADIGDLFSGTYYLYLVVDDGVNVPVFSDYSTSFRPPQIIQGTIANQDDTPQAGWKAFADRNQDGIRQFSEPLSGPSNSDGEYHITPFEASSRLPKIKSITPNVFTNWDFEAGNLADSGGGMVFEPQSGTAFDGQPIPYQGSAAQNPFGGGSYLVHTFYNYDGTTLREQGDTPTGTMESDVFTLPHDSQITFQAAGAGGYVALVEDGTNSVLKQLAPNVESETMQQFSLDASEHAGKTVYLRVVDDSEGDWGHINIDNLAVVSNGVTVQLSTRQTTFNNGLQVGDQVVVSGTSVADYNRTHTIVEIGTTPGEFMTDVTYVQDADGGAAEIVLAPVATSTPFDLVLTSPLASRFGDIGLTAEDVTYSGNDTTQVDFTIQEKSVISGNVFADLARDGQRSTTAPIAQFDFGTPASPIQRGYTQVTESTSYTAARGYGWLGGVLSTDRGVGPAPESLTRDSNYAPDRTFRVDLPNADYHVTLTLGDTGNIVHDDVGVFLQGAQMDKVTTAGGQIVTRTYTNISVSDGTLMLHLRDLGGVDPNWVINGMSIVRADDPSLAGWTVELLQDDQVISSTTSRSDGSYSSTPAEPVTVVGSGEVDLDTYDTARNVINVDLQNGMTLAAGDYAASLFNYEFSRVGNGSVQPLLLSRSGTDYTVIALGDTIDFDTISHGFTSATFGGQATFTLSEATEVFAGFYWHGTSSAIGFENNQGSTFQLFNDPDAPALGQKLSGANSGTFSRAYDFSVAVAPTAHYAVRLVPWNGSSATYSFGASTVNGTTVQDASGGAASDRHEGTLVNNASVGTASSFGIEDHPTATSGNQILRLGGDNQYLEVPAGVDLEPGIGQYSFAGWIRLDDPSKTQEIAGLSDPSGQHDGWALGVSHDNTTSKRLSVMLRASDSSNTLQIGAGPELEADTWYHVAFTYGPQVVDDNGNISYDAVKFYLNGQLQTNIIQVSNNLPANSDISTANKVDFNIGAGGSIIGTSANFFSGYLDDVSVWDSPLSPLQVKSLFHGTASPGYTQRTPTQPGSVPGGYDITVNGAFHVHDNLDFGLEKTVAVGGTIVGESINAQGVLDPSKNVYSDWKVNLVDNNGKVVQSTTTSADGEYVFPNVPTGEYAVQQPISSPQTQEVKAGWRQISPLDPSVQFSDALIEITGIIPDVSATADFDADGNVDLATAYVYEKNLQVVVYWGQGDGTFGEKHGFHLDNVGDVHLINMLAADFTGNKQPDLVIVGKELFPMLFANEGGARDSRFSHKASYFSDVGWTSTLAIQSGNFDGDGQEDLVILNEVQSQGVWLLIAPGNQQPAVRSSTAVQEQKGVTTASIDVGYIDDDDNKDVVLHYGDFVLLWYGLGNGGFEIPNEVVSAEGGHAPSGPASLADVNGDGRLDIALPVSIPSGSSTVAAVQWSLQTDPPTSPEVTAYAVPTNTNGNGGTYNGTLGMDFNVGDRAITVTELGVFDDNSDGIKGVLGAQIYERTTQKLVAHLDFTDGHPGTLEGGSRFKPLSRPISLPAGFQGTIVADGFSIDHYATSGGRPTGTGTPYPWTTNTGNGLVTFVGKSRSSTIEGFPTHIESGPTNRFAAGTFKFQEGAVFGSEQYVAVTGAFDTTQQMLARDFDGDLRPDVLIFGSDSGNQQPLRLLLNQGRGPDWFSAPLTLLNTDVEEFVAADWDGNGLIDLTIMNYGGGAHGQFLTYVNQTEMSSRDISITLDTEDEASDNNFVNGQISQAFGTVFNDLDGNGDQHHDEPGVEGATVYVDLNKDGELNSDEPATTSRSDGSFAFHDLPNGTHHVRLLDSSERTLVDPESGFRDTTIFGGGPTDTDSLNFATAATLLNPVSDKTVAEGTSLAFAVTATEAAAGRNLVFSLDPGAPTAASIDPKSGLITWDGSAAPGAYQITARVTDAEQSTATQTKSFLMIVSSPEFGDANFDGVFDSADLVQVLSAAKYRSGKLANWTEGDWNNDGLFDETDLVLALQSGTFSQAAPNAARAAAIDQVFDELNSASA